MGRDVVDIERRGDGTWRAVGHALDEQGKAGNHLEEELVADNWREAADHLHRLHPDVPGSSSSWRELGPDRVQWSHERHRRRKGSPENPHVVEMRMVPLPVHPPATSVERGRSWLWVLALVAGLGIGVAVVALVAAAL